VLARELQRGLDGLGAGREEVGEVQALRVQPAQLGGESFGGFVRERRAVDVGDLADLLGDGVGELRRAVAQVGDVGAAAGVEVAPALGVDEPAAFAAHDQGELASSAR